MSNQSAVEGDGWRGCINPARAPADEAWENAQGAAREAVLCEAGFRDAMDAIRQWPDYAPTPLHDLPGLARRFGLAELRYKDESARFELKSFKALGGAYAVQRLVMQAIARIDGGARPALDALLRGEWAGVANRITVTCATDGNHGRSVAWGARLFGCRCLIFVHETVSEGRAAAIAAFGAEVVRVPGNYDDAVRHAASQAEANGWTVVSDTTWEGYRHIPIDVMHGYGAMSLEVIEQLGEVPPSHVLVQAGVGAFAASVAAAFWLRWGSQRPRLVIVEPTAAACHLQSALAGGPVAVTGSLDTVMAGLACGEVSPAAWQIVEAAAAAFVAIDDRYALDAVRAFATPAGADPPIVAGETGATGLGALLAAHDNTALRQLIGLDTNSRVLLLGSEGDTDAQIYRDIVGRSAAEVRVGVRS